MVAHCAPRGIVFPHLRKLVVGGAEMDAKRIEALERLLPDGDVLISLGSTEVMPVATIRGRDAVARMTAAGVGAACVGFPAPGHELRIIPIRDAKIPIWSEDLVLPPGAVGEIVIRGPGVTAQYLNRPEQTRLAKIQDGDRFWHRMGDLGSLEADGCLWLYGRKSQRVETGSGPLFTIPCEAVFNRHPGVQRCALVGLGPKGSQAPVIVLELHPASSARTKCERAQLATELVGMAKANPYTAAIRAFAFYPREFPLDIRHNSKIGREKLAAWAARTTDLLRAEDQSA
jgi:acyl-CoA synthetase (AMP-forming)/AMP-acid ligase II